MLISIKVFIIKAFTKEKVVADRRIVKLLSKELYIKKNHQVKDYFFELMDSYAESKSRQELEYLAEIMVSGMNEGNLVTEKKITNLYRELAKMSKKFPPPWSLPENIQQKFKESNIDSQSEES